MSKEQFINTSEL